jgi:hypothetical protein
MGASFILENQLVYSKYSFDGRKRVLHRDVGSGH